MISAMTPLVTSTNMWLSASGRTGLWKTLATVKLTSGRLSLLLPTVAVVVSPQSVQSQWLSYRIYLTMSVGNAIIVEGNQSKHRIDTSDGDTHSLRQSGEAERMNSQFHHAGVLVEDFVSEDCVSAGMEDFMSSNSGEEAEVIAGLLLQSNSVSNSSQSLTNNSPVERKLDGRPKNHVRPASEPLTDTEFNAIYGSDSLLSGSGKDMWSDPLTSQSTHNTSRCAAPQAMTSSVKVPAKRKANTQGKHS